MAYARGRGGSGSTLPLTIGKEIPYFWNDPPFFIQRLPKLLSCFSVRSNLLYLEKNFHCDAIIPQAKLFWCVTLDVDDCKSGLSVLKRNDFSSCGACRNCCCVFSVLSNFLI